MSQPPPGPKDYSWQPQPGNYNSAPSYGRPPRKSRAGLVLALIVILALVALGAVGLLAYRLVSDHKDASSSAGPTGSIAPPPEPSSTRPSSRPTAMQPTATRPTLPPRKTPAGPAAAATDVARRFVAQLNANNPTAAAALSCGSSRQFIPLLMQRQLTPPMRLAVGSAVGQAPTFVFRLSGSGKGTAVTGVVVVQQIAPEPWCVRVFQITTTS